MKEGLRPLSQEHPVKLLHTLIAVLYTLAFGLVGHFLNHSLWLTGAAFAVGWFCSRELAQAEYRWIERNGGLRKNLKWSSVWTSDNVWNEKSWFWDAFLPTLVAVGIAAYMFVYNPKLPF